MRGAIRRRRLGRAVLILTALAGAGSGKDLLAQDAPAPSGAPAPSDAPAPQLPVPLQDTTPEGAPPPQDVILLDPAPADTVYLASDGAYASPDTIGVDSAAVIDSQAVVVIRHLPEAAGGVPAGWHTAVWEWGEEELLAVRALTLFELLSGATGIVPLQGGDYGQPAAISAFGVEGGRVRIFVDGVEVPPLDGGVVDLSRVGLGGIGRVRMERRPGEVRIDLTPIHLIDPRPYSLVEVATGDLNTNAFRGTFGHPDALGGNVLVYIDRIDTEGTDRGEPGVSFGAGIRHTIFLGENGGVVWELRRMSSKRPSALWSPATVQRNDFGVQARYALPFDLLGVAFVRTASLKAVGESSIPGEDGAEVVPDVGIDPRRIYGARLSVDREGLWGEAESRRQTGERWASSVQLLRGGGELPWLGGASASYERESWEGGRSAATVHLSAWTAPRFGISIFGELYTGEKGIPGRVLPPEPTPSEEDEGGDEGEGEEGEEPEEIDPWIPSFVDRTGLRAGARGEWGNWALGAAFLRVEADSLHPMEFLPDRVGAASGAGIRTGVEVTARLPLTRVMRGLFFEGSAQFWEDGAAWRYLPSRMYQGRLTYHGLFYDTGNLEVWWDLGVRGRTAMLVPQGTSTGGGFEEVPFRQSWFARVQVRVVSVRLFLDWENFSAREFNQDFPDRILPKTRISYGIRWTLWN